MKADADYHVRFRETQLRAAQALEDEAIERASIGVFEPNVFQGRYVYPQEEYVVKEAVLGPRGRVIEPEVRSWRDVPGASPLGLWKKSDALLMFLLRGFMPEKYGMWGAFELVGPQRGPIEIVERLNAGRSRMAS
jgi:hypothetical protein